MTSSFVEYNGVAVVKQIYILNSPKKTYLNEIFFSSVIPYFLELCCVLLFGRGYFEKLLKVLIGSLTITEIQTRLKMVSKRGYSKPFSKVFRTFTLTN